MAKSSWDDMRRAREAEYFLKDEREKISALKAQRQETAASLEQTHETIKNFTRGFSPISGGKIFRAYVGNDVILDCPEEGVITLPYDTLEKLLLATEKNETSKLEKWREFITYALEEKPAPSEK